MVKKNLKLAILKKYDCQGDFAQELQVPESKVSQVLRGRRQLTEQEKQRWAQALGVPLQEAFGD
jgi:plasmid maintenance system antidote protein VapI